MSITIRGERCRCRARTGQLGAGAGVGAGADVGTHRDRDRDFLATAVTVTYLLPELEENYYYLVNILLHKLVSQSRTLRNKFCTVRAARRPRRLRRVAPTAPSRAHYSTV